MPCQVGKHLQNNISRKPPRPNPNPGEHTNAAKPKPGQRHARRGRKTTTTKHPNRYEKGRMRSRQGSTAKKNEPAAEGGWPRRRTGPDGRPTDRRAAGQTGGRRNKRQAASTQRGARQEGGRRPGARGGAERGTSRQAERRTATEAGRTDTGTSGQPQGRRKQGKGGEARHAADGAARARHEKMRSIRLTDGKIIYTISRSIYFRMYK